MSTLRVNTLQNTSTTDGGISINNSGHVTVDGVAMPSAGPLSNRNLIINGAMQVAQRGTSTTSAGYLLDRFYYSTSGATGTCSQENFTIGQTDVPGADKYLKLDITTGDNNSGIYHKIEAKNAFGAIGKKVTLSYYAKGTSPTNGLQVGILWYDGSTASSRADTTVTLTSSWVKYTHTFDVPSISGLTLTNASAYLQVSWQQASTDTGTAAYQLQLAQVQLEVGSVATPFEHRSYGDELRRCQRYFQVCIRNEEFVTACVTSSSGANTGLAFVNEMRAAPTVTLATAGSSAGNVAFLTTGGGTPSTIGSHEALSITTYGFRFKASGYSASGWTSGAATNVYGYSTATVYTASAEL